MRKAIGIDLGTTHTVVAWADLDGSAPPVVFPIPQLVAPAEIAARPLLASCLYAPIPGEAVMDPWGDAPWITGELARRRGSEVPGRLVASAKSWLCHAGVDRTAPILPWGADEEAAGLPRISPIDASARCLAHVRRAWDEAFPADRLSDQEVILTVPASFDEVARELTLEAARRAGLSVRLLEEPQAAFYDYVSREGPRTIDWLMDNRGGALALVCDVGGGTTDLSLIRACRGVDGEVALTRIAVGRHLLLGGDNMDLAIAHLCEARLMPSPAKLDALRFAQLVNASRIAKEKLLSPDAPESASVTVLSQGARLLGGSISTEISRLEVEQVVLGGFFPPSARDARPTRARSGLVGFGLPYERDVAITRHVAEFFARHAPDAAGPTALLLNGGVFRARRIEERMVEAIEGWGGPALNVLPHPDPDLAVARGAVAYAIARSGRGLRIGGGVARGYYVGLKAPATGPRPAICVVPRGAEEGKAQIVEGPTLALVIGRPVRFDLFASDVRSDPAGAIVTVDDDRFEALPPVAVAFDSTSVRPGALGPKAPRGAGEEVNVALEGELSAVGTLDLSCVELQGLPGQQPRRFHLAFQVRASEAAKKGQEQAPPSKSPTTAARGTPSQRRLADAREAIDRVFGRGRPDVTPREVKDLVRELERTVGERASWTTEVTRALFDTLAPGHRSRRRSVDHERVFWLLAGFCVRPGFGDPLDIRRTAELASLFPERVFFPQEPRNYQQFWIAFRRAAGGLDETAQVAIRDTLDPLVAPSEKRVKKPKGWKAEAPDDLLELAAALERVPAARRSELGGWILERTWTTRDPKLWAAIGRIGARIPGYASAHHVVAPAVAERWIDHLLREKWEDLPTAPEAAMRLARVTGDRARDVADGVRASVARRLTAAGAREDWVRAVKEFVAVEEKERAAFFGEALPVGLKLVG